MTSFQKKRERNLRDQFKHLDAIKALEGKESYSYGDLYEVHKLMSWAYTRFKLRNNPEEFAQKFKEELKTTAKHKFDKLSRQQQELLDKINTNASDMKRMVAHLEEQHAGFEGHAQTDLDHFNTETTTKETKLQSQLREVGAQANIKKTKLQSQLTEVDAQANTKKAKLEAQLTALKKASEKTRDMMKVKSIAKKKALEQNIGKRKLKTADKSSDSAYMEKEIEEVRAFKQRFYNDQPSEDSPDVVESYQTESYKDQPSIPAA